MDYMARYYEETALIEFVKERTPTINGETTMECVERAIREAPTADVVPKSEVDKLQNNLVIWKQDRFNLYQRLELYKMAQEKVAREIFEEIDGITDLFAKGLIGELEMYDKLAELKNKYTESEGKG